MAILYSYPLALPNLDDVVLGANTGLPGQSQADIKTKTFTIDALLALAGTNEYVSNRLVIETAVDYTLTNADSGGIIIFTATASLIVPTGLADGFECTFVTLAGVTLTLLATGNTLYNNDGYIMLPELTFTLKRRLATNSFIVTGNI